jgi:hypothetical protein
MRKRNLAMFPLHFAMCSALLIPATTAQSGSFVAAGFLGPSSPAGDVDDDGWGDYLRRSVQGWEVRSGATGMPFPQLARSIANCLTCVNAGLLQDTLRGAFPMLRAVDYDGDGHDDVMVVQSVASSGNSGNTSHFVSSGRTGALPAIHAMGYTGTNSGRVQWCGDVDGDGYVDLLRTTTSCGNPYTEGLLGPLHSIVRMSFSGTPVLPAGDTNADGRDELIVGTDLVDVVTGAVVWAMFPLFPSPEWFFAVVDGDGDIDADGCDELTAGFTRYELQGAPRASYVRDRGTAGTTSVMSRPRIRHRLRPRIGDSMHVDLHGAGGPWLTFLAIGTAVDIDLAPLGAAGNRAFVQPLVAPSPFADATGRARYVLTVPSAPALVGLPLSLQWIVLDPAATSLGVVTSNALDCRVGN